MANKLGIESSIQNRKIIQDLEEVMHECGTHFTNFFRVIENSIKEKMSQ